MNEQVHPINSGEAVETAGKIRKRSEIAFPYYDFSDSASVAKVVYDTVGVGTCQLTQIAAWVDQSIKSSSFRMQVSAAKLFGLLMAESVDTYRVTELGRKLQDPESAKKAKIDAFLSIPLYSALYDRHKDGVLPPAAALEREIAGLGVPDKQKDRARLIFERSAEQTGFFGYGKNRLVMPGIPAKEAGSPTQEPAEQPSERSTGGGGPGGGDGAGLNLDPLLMALLRKIPATEEGWPAEKRARWFRTFAMNVSQVYDPDDKDPVDLDIKLPEKKGANNDNKSTEETTK